MVLLIFSPRWGCQFPLFTATYQPRHCLNDGRAASWRPLLPLLVVYLCYRPLHLTGLAIFRGHHPWGESQLQLPELLFLGTG